MLFNSWHNLFQVIGVGVLAYAALVIILRVSGKRTLAKMNAFDFVVTVALGSTFATMLLSKTVSLSEGILALSLLALLQFLVAWTALRSPFVKDLVKSSPRALLRNGEFDEAALRSERVSRDEILAAVRGAGYGDISDIAAVVLETDGSFSVISGA